MENPLHSLCLQPMRLQLLGLPPSLPLLTEMLHLRRGLLILEQSQVDQEPHPPTPVLILAPTPPLPIPLAQRLTQAFAQILQIPTQGLQLLAIQHPLLSQSYQNQSWSPQQPPQRPSPSDSECFGMPLWPTGDSPLRLWALYLL